MENLRGKKIAIVGLGTNNRKLADHLTKQGIVYETIDGWKNADELIGKLDNYDIIFRTPGLPLLSKAVQQAQEKGVTVSSQTKLFFELCPAVVIGVTGTKGKGTTSSLIAKILEEAGNKVWLGGNIGRDPFEFLEKIKPADLVILELSSFQLQDLTQSPHIAVVLNITSDHLNHHISVDEYVKAKSSIIAFQADKDYAVLHHGLPDWFKKIGSAQKVIFNSKDSPSFNTKLIGEHNQENISAAAAAAKLLGVDEAVIRKVVAEFEPLPHRLNKIREINGVCFIDDTFSTNLDPTIAAIDALKSPLILIVGGSDKGLDFTFLGQKIKSTSNIKGLVVVGQVADKILNAASGFSGKILTGAESMQEILSQARSMASQGDTILFSPATASFGMFKNEYDRGEQFVKEVEAI